jgi:hypothetical protein
MKALQIRMSDDLFEWLANRADKSHRSQNKQVIHYLEQIKHEEFVPRYILNSPKLCNNGQHHFIKAEPAMSDYCNCGVFIYGEVQR